MASVKTAISLDANLLERVNAVAADLKMSRSRLFVQAVEEFIQGIENQNLLRHLNAAYDHPPDEEEERLAHHLRTKQRSLLRENVW